MVQLIDLSHEITDKMPVHPEDRPLKLYRNKTLYADGYNNHRLEAGMHTGTHLDGPMHMTESREYISNISVDHFYGTGKLFDVRNKMCISYKNEYDDQINENDIVLFYTAWDRHFGKDEYYENYPVIDEEFAAFLVNREVKIVGIDSPSPDKEPYPVHTILLKNSICIIENLTNFDTLSNCNHFEVIAFPLKIRADASFVRVVAKVVD